MEQNLLLIILVVIIAVVLYMFINKKKKASQATDIGESEEPLPALETEETEGATPSE